MLLGGPNRPSVILMHVHGSLARYVKKMQRIKAANRTPFVKLEQIIMRDREENEWIETNEVVGDEMRELYLFCLIFFGGRKK